MNIVVIKWSEGSWAESQKALKMVDWCKGKKLSMGTDFIWNFDVKNKKTIFEFFGEKNTYSSFFAIVFSENS